MPSFCKNSNNSDAVDTQQIDYEKPIADQIKYSSSNGKSNKKLLIKILAIRCEFQYEIL